MKLLNVSGSSCLFLLKLIHIQIQIPSIHAILPTGEIALIDLEIDGTTTTLTTTTTLLASQGSFAPYPPMSKYKSDSNSDSTSNKAYEYTYGPLIPILPPENDSLLCNSSTNPDDYNTNANDNNNNKPNPLDNDAFVYVVPRGVCSFEHKALIAQLYGASGIIIYGTLFSRYGYNETIGSIDYPLEYHDYDCSSGKGSNGSNGSHGKGNGNRNGVGRVHIPKSKLIGFDDTNDGSNTQTQSPYNSQNDALLSGSAQDGNLCALYDNNNDSNSNSNNSFEQACPSQKCLLTGNQTITTDGTNQPAMEACCAWDTHIYLYGDDSMNEVMKDPNLNDPYNNNAQIQIQPIRIPTFYITMNEGDELLRYMHSHMDGTRNSGVIRLNMYTRWYPKYNLSTVVIWAVGVLVATLASYLSAGEIRHVRKMIVKNQEQGGNENSSSSNNISNRMSKDDGANDTSTTVSVRGYEPVFGTGQTQQQKYKSAIPPEETLELAPEHAIFFILFSSAGLLTLFFFKIYKVVKVFYAFGCSGAILQMIVIPFYQYMARKLNIRDRVAFTTDVAEIGTVTVLDMLSISTAYGIGSVWIYMAFAYRHPETIPFFWIMQNIMGACMCILFLQTMKLNSIKVASILLTAAFLYDIFFVFVTPFLTEGGKSIMVDVATSGGPPTADPDWCEKYPDGPECQGGDPLPMLFTIPRINDYAGGSSLLGLGDIVLPGLLLSFAARYDEAKKLVGASHSPHTRTHSPNQESICSSHGGYFVPAVIAYGIGLGMANVAVYVMKMGQPALLYLVPCCLGIIVYLGWKRGELQDLWNTPRVLASCDIILHGETEENESLVNNGSNRNDNDIEGSNHNEEEMNSTRLEIS